jgi:hypothetical protein
MGRLSIATITIPILIAVVLQQVIGIGNQAFSSGHPPEGSHDPPGHEPGMFVPFPRALCSLLHFLTLFYVYRG